MPLPLITRLRRAADRDAAVTFINGPERVKVPWAQLHEEASAVAAAIQARGIVPGNHVAILGPTSRALVTSIQGCWLAGAASMVLPLPMRMGSIEEFISSTRARLRHGDAALLLLDDGLAPFYEAAEGDPPTVSLSDVLPGPGRPGPEALELPAPDPERLVILQYTSGSTAEPKGVMIPDRVLGANLDAIVAGSEFVPTDDVLVSWLPLYHDMGLVGLLASSMSTGANLVQAAPQDFLAHPGSWMQWISDFRGTITAGPNFAWVLAARALRRMASIDLSSLRIALNGAEPIDPDAVEAFTAEAGRFGFPAGAVFCAFGMAEHGIGATFPPVGRGLRTDRVDRVVLEEKGVAEPAEADAPSSRRLPMLGFPVPGLEVRVCDSSGDDLPDRRVGEVELRGTSVTPGYYKRPDATAAVFHDDWLRTGDLGYLVDGELVLCGRIKDVIIVGGRNVFPEDIERAVGTIEGVRAGNVIAFGVDTARGKESVVVVAEARGEDLEQLHKAVHTRAQDVVGLPPRDVVLVRPGTLPKTSSGKLQRATCRQRSLAGELQKLD